MFNLQSVLTFIHNFAVNSKSQYTPLGMCLCGMMTKMGGGGGGCVACHRHVLKGGFGRAAQMLFSIYYTVPMGDNTQFALQLLGCRYYIVLYCTRFYNFVTKIKKSFKVPNWGLGQ